MPTVAQRLSLFCGSNDNFRFSKKQVKKISDSVKNYWDRGKDRPPLSYVPSSEPGADYEVRFYPDFFSIAIDYHIHNRFRTLQSNLAKAPKPKAAGTENSSTNPNNVSHRVRKPKGMRKTTCSKCGNELEPSRVEKYRYCMPCHATYMRETRPKHSELTPEQRLKSNARAYANVYQNKGRFEKMPCSVCGAEVAEKHHDDYSKPMEFKWLCRPCHLAHHKVEKSQRKRTPLKTPAYTSKPSRND